MHIVIVTDYAYINGGAGKVALSSALGLADRGHSVTIFTAVPPIMPELYHPNIRLVNTSQHDILSHPFLLKAALQGLWNMDAFRKMSDILSSLDPSETIIHLHTWTKALSSSVVRTALTRNFTVVLTLHDYFSACPNGGFFHYGKSRICNLKPLSLRCIMENCDCRNYPQKIWRIMRQIVQKKYGMIPNGIRNYISVSSFSLAIMKPYLPDGCKMYSIPNPVESCQEQIVDVGNNDTLFFVGRLSPEKGIIPLVSAICKEGCSITFVGDGPCRQYIESELPAAPVTGWLPAAGVRQHMKKARALIFPPLWYETQGLVVLEAASVGVPSIVSDTSSARELVINGVTGLWFRGGDENDLIEKIRIIQDRDTAQAMGRAAYEQYWTNPCTMERHVKMLENCYDEILKKEKITS